MSQNHKNFSTISVFLTLLTVILFMFLMVQPKVLNAGEWQKKYNYPQLRENFKQPPLWYAPHTFWFWDAPLNPELTATMAKEMTKQRLNPG